MNITMQNIERLTLDQIREFVEGSRTIGFTAPMREAVIGQFTVGNIEEGRDHCANAAIRGQLRLGTHQQSDHIALIGTLYRQHRITHRLPLAITREICCAGARLGNTSSSS